MTIAKNVNGKELTVSVAGRLDTTTAPKLDEELKAAITGMETLIIDFSALEYISSAGLRVLLSSHKTMQKQGKMIVRNINETVAEVFDITGFSDILTVE